jgi:hypothetical protein
MTVTWGDLDSDLESMQGVASLATPADRLRAFNKAQDYFASNHTAKKLSASYATGGSSPDVVLPDDYIDLYAVYSNELQMFLEQKEYWPGVAYDTSTDETYRADGYIEWPHGTVRLMKTPAVDAAGIEIWYFGQWPTLSGSTATVEVPLWSHEALLCYAAAFALLPSLTDATFLNEYKTRVDSGTPVMNPLKLAVDAYMARYEYLLRDRPKQLRRLLSGGP